MSLFFEILPGTEPYKIANQLFTYDQNWHTEEVTKDIEALGIKMNGNVLMWPFYLVVQSVPENLRGQFKKNRNRQYRLEAKKKSPINQKFLEIVKKHGLIYRQTSDLSFCIGCGYGFVQSYSTIDLGGNPRYFVEAKSALNEDSLNFLRTHKALAELSEINYQKLKLEYLEKLEKEQQPREAGPN